MITLTLCYLNKECSYILENVCNISKSNIIKYHHIFQKTAQVITSMFLQKFHLTVSIPTKFLIIESVGVID